MPNLKVRDLEGSALDWAVATAAGRTVRRDPMAFHDKSYWVWEETPSGRGGVDLSKSVYMRIGREYSPSTKWEQAGPLIEDYSISLERRHDGWWAASCRYNYADEPRYTHLAHSPLVAAMRCLCEMSIGAVIETPRDLTLQV